MPLKVSKCLRLFRIAAATLAYPSSCFWLSRDKTYNVYVYTRGQKKKGKVYYNGY